MSDVAIKVEGLSKRYRIGGPKEPYGSLRDTLMSAARGPWKALRGERKPAPTDFWALQDVSFEVKQGEVLGIIGRNGAGKSTLLKVLARITEPTKGQVEIRGRVGSLLEVGTGFHPELTGRENVYLSGAILGMSRAEITRKFDEIVAFAEVAQFVDTPVKRFSSGMYLRLAFSVAAHLEPEILVVDEVLAVGDAEFQKRCLGKMNQVAGQGRTVLFVSHNTAALSALCTRGLLLQCGQVQLSGEIASVLDAYLADHAPNSGSVTIPTAPDDADHDFRFRSVSVSAPDGTPTGHVARDDAALVTITYEVRSPLRICQVGFELWNAQGVCVFASTDLDSTNEKEGVHVPSTIVARCRIPGSLLREGRYSLTVAASVPHVRPLDHQDRILSFEVDDTTSLESRMRLERKGIVMPALHWWTEPLHENTSGQTRELVTA